MKYERIPLNKFKNYKGEKKEPKELVPGDVIEEAGKKETVQLVEVDESGAVVVVSVGVLVNG